MAYRAYLSKPPATMTVRVRLAVVGRGLLLGGRVVQFEDFYNEYQGYVVSTVRKRLELYRLCELRVAEVVAEAWSRIWEHWEWVSKGTPPIVAARKVALDACTVAKNRVTGRTAMMRGKPYRWRGTRDDVLFSQLEDRAERFRDGDDGSFAFEWATVPGRRRRLLSPLEVAILREELFRFGGRPAELLEFYLGAAWKGVGRDAHFRHRVAV